MRNEPLTTHHSPLTTHHSPTWLEGRCVSIGESIGYWVFIDILRSYLQFSQEDSPKELGEKIVDRMKALSPPRWEEIVPYIGNLLSVKFGNEWDERVKYLPPEQVKHQTFLTLRDVFLALAQQKPLLLILEDLHWADNLSLDLLTLLMDVLTLAPLMLLCIYRPEKEHKSWHIGTQASAKCLDRYKEITLRALSPQECRRLVESLLRIENLPQSVKESILQKSEGNPFFVEELIRSLIDSGVVYRDGERWVAKAEIETTAVPDTVQNVIMARIDRLEDEVRYVLQSAAVIGRLFRHTLLQYTTQQERNLDRYLWQLEERDLVYEERAIPELEYSFKHALTQETAYNTILSRRRKEFHRNVGEGYEALYSSRIEEYYEELAYHYSRSDALEKAVEYLIKAGDKSKKAFANHQAIGYYNEAMENLDGLSDEQAREISKGKALEGLGEVYYNLGERSKAVENLQEAIPFAIKRGETPYRVAELHFWLSDSLHLMGRQDDALKWAEAGLTVLGEDLTCSQAALLFHVLGFAYMNKGNRKKSNEYLSKNKAMIEANQLGYFDKIYIVYLGIGIWEGNRNIDSALMWMRNCAEICENHRNDVGVAEAYICLGVWLTNSNDRQAAECFEKSLTVCRQIEYGKYLLTSYCWLMRTLCRLGEEKKAKEWLLQGAGLAETKRHLGIAHGYLSEMYLNRGNPERAKEHLEVAIGFCRDTDDVSAILDKRVDFGGTLPHMIEMARYHLRVGIFLEEALVFAQKAVQLHPNVYTINTLGWACFQKGDTEKAIECCKKALGVGMSNSALVAQTLGLLEEAFAKAGKREEFIAYCKELKKEKGEELQSLKLTYWYLEPKELSGLFTQTGFVDEFDQPALKSEWEWINPKGDSSYSLSSEPGWLEVRAASGSYLYWNNFDAPRLLQEIPPFPPLIKGGRGDFAAEVKVKSASDDLPSVGGLLIWKDEENYIRFEKGMHGKDEISLSGNVGGKFDYFGRGTLASEVVYLRLERIGDRISAYCSNDGENWLTCGEMRFPAEAPIKIGIHAIGGVGLRGGAMDTATRFDYFKIFRIPE